MAKHTVREELVGVLIFVGAIWVAFLVNWIIPFDFNAFGVTPRSLQGIFGIICMPFLHADFNHLISNTLPLVVLLVLLSGSKANSWAIVAYIVLIGGSLLWLFGRSSTHVGASGLIYGLSAFLMVSGILERRLIPLIIAIVVGIMYGGTLLSGVVPKLDSHISWEGHLLGAVAGGLVAFMTTRKEKQRESLSA